VNKELHETESDELSESEIMRYRSSGQRLELPALSNVTRCFVQEVTLTTAYCVATLPTVAQGCPFVRHFPLQVL
jgi:hypothetical protein